MGDPIDVVIGAAFGDEGKGLITHYLASAHGKDALVVRFNGGAQAGHTVVTQQGQRHVFRHVGSGAFAGAETFLSRFFVSNPILFLQELEQLALLRIKPRVYVDPASPLTTPYDMMANQIAEAARGSARHGSCGVGFAETIERNTQAEFALAAGGLEDLASVADTLQRVRKRWLPQRLSALRAWPPPGPWRRYLDSEDIFQLYLRQLEWFREAIVVRQVDFSDPNRRLVFEGAQGLMLDQTRGWFPHVTRSHTGLQNVLELTKCLPHKELNVVYVTRSYLTRHGAGPLPHELPALPYARAIDHTNVENAHQGKLRYAWFNLGLLKSFVQADLATVPSTAQVNAQLAVTCLDQADGDIAYADGETICQAPQEQFLHKVANELGIANMLCTYGPTIATIEKWRGLKALQIKQKTAVF